MLDVCNIQVMKPLLAYYGFHFSKAKGQNFLTAGWVPEQMAERSGVNAHTGVLEIGPGIGPLTQQLCLRAGKVCAVELDRRLEPILAQTVGEFSNLNILWGDILKMDIRALVTQQFPGVVPMACANLPYYITSPILSSLLESKCFSAISVMVQKEVAQRITAAPGTPDYSAFTIFCQYYAAPEILFEVPAHCFMPQPKVTSAVVLLRSRDCSTWQVDREDLFFRVVRGSFAMRRKTLQNGLSSAFPNLSKAEIAQILENCGLAPTVRGETLDIPTFAAIANEIGRRTEHV
jgi:16S rRNA (adenine1518-N6/adenine1519-N6)-dimethyltransferase